MGKRAAGKSVSPSRTVLVIAGALALVPATAQAGSPVNTGYFGEVAIKGYDPVAYFVGGRPIEGSEEFSYEWLGATWRFSTAEHRDLFVEAPTSYTPQYGGFCATAVAFEEEISNIDPEAWDIVDGKLYLQYSRSVQEEWHTDLAGFLALSEQNWPEIKADVEARTGG